MPKGNSLTPQEVRFVKKLLNLNKYSNQEIAGFINRFRGEANNDVNSGRITNIKKNQIPKYIPMQPCNDEELEFLFKKIEAFDSRTGLNLYDHGRLIKAREAMISAVQIFNSPTIVFKIEIFCVLSNIAWTYLLHEKVELTNQGSSKLQNGNSITVNGTLDSLICPIQDKAVKENLRKLIKIRDAVEHIFFVGGEDCFGPLFQANCINFEHHITEWFGHRLSLTKDLSLALQFVRLQKDQAIVLETSHLPEKIRAISTEINSNELASNPAFQFQIHYTTEVSSKTSTELHKLVTYDQDVEANVVAIKRPIYIKLSQAEVVKKINSKGYPKFSKQDHLNFWKTKWATKEKRNLEATQFGEIVLKDQWLWYEQFWLPQVLKHCQEAGNKYK